jgi:23S rRNA (uracil1939-C5)-methyltransferase
LQHLPAEEQRARKQQALLEALWRGGRLEPQRLLAPVHLDHPWGYRRKARLGTRFLETEGKALVGFRCVGGHSLAEMAGCPVLHPRLDALITPLRGLLAELSVRGQVLKIEAAVGDDDEAAIILRSMAAPTPADRHRLQAFGAAHRLGIRVQAGSPAVETLIRGAEELEYRLPEFGLVLGFRPDDFIQANGVLNRSLVGQAVALLDPQPEDRILDLFSGLGNFALPLARRAGEVVGVEGSPDMARRSEANARRNGLDNFRGHAANLYGRRAALPASREPFSKALIDPPRSGAGPTLGQLPALGVERLLYVSCLLDSLGRDAAELAQRHGYRLTAAGILDMFPHTEHVESMALFER